MFIRTAIRFRQPTMVLGDDLLNDTAIREIAGSSWLFAVLANRLDQLGVPSVIGDDNHGIRLIADHLHSLGHKRIALLHNNSGHPIENIQIAVWRAVTEGAPELPAEVPTGAQPVEYAFQAVSRALDQDQKTNDQQNAINMENQGNELLAQGSYESAITFYRVAQASYKQLGLTELADGIDKKMEAAQAGIAAKEAQAAEAEKQKSE